MTPDSCRGAERNMGLSPPLLTSGSRSGGVESPFLFLLPSSLLPAPLLLFQSLQRQYPTVTYTRLSCVNDDPDFLKIAAGWANPHIKAMLSVPQYHEHIQTRRLDFD